MLRQLVPVLVCITIGWLLYAGGRNRLKAQKPEGAASEDRVANARANVQTQIQALFSEHQLPYPPPQIFLRAFKAEQQLELWAGDPKQPLKLLRTYALTANSGGPGPKRKEGDKQIPEGCYVIDRFNP
ncbi:MAG TPA: hypothetical protein VFG14_04185, partial [Chthoniobacteraceae bacterium]|nr:hypothetical protein [Chthoniobacteraceae bacterium]